MNSNKKQSNRKAAIIFLIINFGFDENEVEGMTQESKIVFKL